MVDLGEALGFFTSPRFLWGEGSQLTLAQVHDVAGGPAAAGGGKLLVTYLDDAVRFAGRVGDDAARYLGGSRVVRAGVATGVGAAAAGAGVYVAGTAAGAGVQNVREGFFGKPGEPGALGPAAGSVVLLVVVAVAVFLILRGS